MAPAAPAAKVVAVASLVTAALVVPAAGPSAVLASGQIRQTDPGREHSPAAKVAWAAVADSSVTAAPAALAATRPPRAASQPYPRAVTAAMAALADSSVAAARAALAAAAPPPAAPQPAGLPAAARAAPAAPPLPPRRRS